MTRISAAAAFLICLAFSILSPVLAQTNRTMATDNGCFPWQDFKSGQCVAKPAQAPPPALPAPAEQAVAPPPPPPPPVVAAPEPPAAPSPPARDSVTRAPNLNMVCDGGTVTDGICACPAGYTDNGGACVRTKAENCLGGQLSASGQCMCTGQVTMDGETYLLEYANGKCLPMRCPVTASLHDGRCVAGASPQLSSGPESKPLPPAKEVKNTDDDEPPRRVPPRRRVQNLDQSRMHQYYRRYRWPGMGAY
jgi:hypothetical protein